MKTVAATVPGAGAAAEILNQLEGGQFNKRLTHLEEADVELRSQLLEMEQAETPAQPVPKTWPAAVAEFFRRVTVIAISYDGGFHSRAERGKDFVQPVAHGCFVGLGEVLTCTEALELAQHAAKLKHGKAIMISGFIRYEFDHDAPDKRSGLVLCRVANPLDQSSEKIKNMAREDAVPQLIHKPEESPVAATITPFLGQEIGFLHSGEATDVWTFDASYDLQFDKSYISHFRHPKDEAFKVFVTGVLPGRVSQAGAPVFNQEGKLLGIIAETESYNSDSGRRAIVKSLLGHPRFMKKKPPEPEG